MSTLERVDVTQVLYKVDKMVDDFSFSGRIEQKTKGTSALYRSSSRSLVGVVVEKYPRLSSVQLGRKMINKI